MYICIKIYATNCDSRIHAALQSRFFLAEIAQSPGHFSLEGPISQATTSGLATVQPIKFLNQKCKADADNYLFVSDKQR